MVSPKARRITLACGAALSLLLDASPAPATAEAEAPLVRRAEPFTFHYPPGYERVVATLAERGPAELERVSRILGLPVPEHADVFVLPRKGGVDPSGWGVPGGPDWASGLALSDRPVIVLRTAEDSGPGGNRVLQVFVHELVHLVTSDALGPAHGMLPSWLKEGTASWLAREWRAADGFAALRLTVGGGYVPLAEIRYGFPRDAERARLAYLESFAFVAWLVEERGEAALRQVFVRVHEGESFDSAFRAVYGQTASRLEDRWKKGFLRRYRWVPLVTSSSTVWILATVLFVAGWARKKRRDARRMESWAEEEEEEAARVRERREREGAGETGTDP